MSLKKSCRVVALIQARLTSTRLPRKILRYIGDKTVLQHCIDNVKRSKRVDEVYVISPHTILNHDVEIYDDEKDVLKRYFMSAFRHQADVVVRITADCPFIDSKVIDIAIEYYFHSGLEYVCFAPIDGMDVEVFSMDLLCEAYLNAKDDYDKEHVTPYMRRKTKLSIDTERDLQKARRWYGLHK